MRNQNENEEDNGFLFDLFAVIFYNIALVLAYIPAFVMDLILTPIVLVIYGKIVFGFVRGVWKYQKGLTSDCLRSMFMSEEERARHRFKTL